MVGEYYTIPLSAPFDSDKYLAAIKECESNGIEVVVIDSLSHAWAGEGGFLDMQGNIAKRTGSSFNAWRDVTPKYNRLWDHILQCPMHVIVTMRSKVDYVIEDNGRGKSAPKKVGLAAVMREGADYETTLFFEIDADHTATATKDRTNTFKGQFFTITPDTGKQIYNWLASGGEPLPVPQPSAPVAPIEKAKPVKAPEPVASELDEDEDDYPTDLPFDIPEEKPSYSKEATIAMMDEIVSATAKEDKKALGAKIKSITGATTANYKTYDEENLRKLYEAFGGKS